MDNKEIIKAIRTTADLMELHEENEFKVKSFRNAVFNLERYNGDLTTLDQQGLEKVKGVGSSIAASIFQYLTTGDFELHKLLVESTPRGVVDMMQVKGLGVKKIKILWKELGIESVNQLANAIKAGELSDVKGFGQKTQDNILESISFMQENQGKLLYAEACAISAEILEIWSGESPGTRIEETGGLRRRMDILDSLSYLVADSPEVRQFIRNSSAWSYLPDTSGPGIYRCLTREGNHTLEFHFAEESGFNSEQFILTGSIRHLLQPINGQTPLTQISAPDETQLYSQIGLPLLPPELREGYVEKSMTADTLEMLLKPADIRGVIHCHSTWSDGLNTIREMAESSINKGYEYLGLTDHSKSAYFYANGLYEERVLEQMEEIEELNQELSPFRIFKGIESDILVDGSLDYDNEILEKFDFIVASIHGGITNDIDKITKRLLKVVENPFTTIMGHLTGRLLLMREGYPVDHKTIIDACAANGVIIEINAHPRRLDLDWRWVHYAMEKGVMLSVNPDAHRTEGIDDIQWGVWSGRKGGLTRELTFNTKTVSEVEAYLKERKARH